MCLLMHDAEPLKPSNTGWLIADVVAETFAFGWSRTEVDAQLEAVLADPQWQPYVVFPQEFVHEPARAVQQLAQAHPGADAAPARRPLFILLDATWPEARKMFRKSPYLDRFPVLSLHPEQISRYQLRRSRRDDHFCTAEVAALMAEAGLLVTVALISPFRDGRQRARERVAPRPFVEVFCNSPLSVCEARDPKGLYRRVQAGKVAEFTGITSPYEVPLQPELVLDTAHTSSEHSIDLVLQALKAMGGLGPFSAGGRA
jgi:hypothetical protein